MTDSEAGRHRAQLPIRDCDECQNFMCDPDYVPCPLHKPRFYAPKDMGAAVYGRYGYRRRCEGFIAVKKGRKR